MQNPVVRHPNVSWVNCQVGPRGAFRCVCLVCKAAMAEFGSGQAADAFARAHAAHQSENPTHYGLGDLIAKATGALGIKPCSPCEARRREANRMFPQVMRRR